MSRSEDAWLDGLRLKPCQVYIHFDIETYWILRSRHYQGGRVAVDLGDVVTVNPLHPSADHHTGWKNI